MNARGQRHRSKPYLFARTDRRSFAFAGIWKTRTVDELKIATYAILTTGGNDLSAPIHNRMSLIVDPPVYDAWLRPDSKPQNYESALAHPDDGALETYPVSKAVNSPKNDSPERARRIAL
jgi:putative SOS response-associated peptidase YedK